MGRGALVQDGIGGMTRVQRLKLDNFKAFERFTTDFGSRAFLVGPNNAGKSTLISALRTTAYMLRHASSRSPDRLFDDGPRQVAGFGLAPDRFGLMTENLRHEFHQEEARIEVTFSNRAKLTAVWPIPKEEGEDTEDDYEDDEYDDTDEPAELEGFFYLTLPNGLPVRRPLEARRGFPRMGVVPILMPIEHDEKILSQEHVRRNIDGRLASRHFRNQLYWLGSETRRDDPVDMEDFRKFSAEWLPELVVKELYWSGEEIDLYYQEAGSRVEKEIYWAGDGIQVWVQLLLHLCRLRSSDVVVLDEPDVYLHPDLQRRLVRLLESLDCQTVTASHSPEVLAEASPDSIVWVDKSRRRAVRSPAPDVMSKLTWSLGTQFNLRIARALRTKVAVFVEGRDMRILSLLARTVNAGRVANESGIVTIPIEGFDKWTLVEVFAWLSDQLLERSVASYVVLDSDYRTDATLTKIRARLQQLGIGRHIWRRKELESYLIEGAPISRISGAPLEWIDDELAKIAASMRRAVLARRWAEFSKEARGLRLQEVTASERFTEEFEQRWADSADQIALCPAKDVISNLNDRLTKDGWKAVSTRALAREIGVAELAEEVATVLIEIDQLAESK